MVKPAEKAPPPASSGGKQWIIIGVVALVAVAAGAALPMVVLRDHADKAAAPKTAAKEPKSSLIPFGDTVVVNLNTDRLARFLKLKIILVADDVQEKTIKELLEKNKPFLKNWLIAFLSDQSLKDVTGAAGQNRIRREIRDQFNTMIFPDGSEKISDVIYEEFNVQ